MWRHVDWGLLVVRDALAVAQFELLVLKVELGWPGVDLNEVDLAAVVHLGHRVTELLHGRGDEDLDDLILMVAADELRRASCG